MMMSELPDDLLDEIFFCVPATSLNRLRSTCKRWNLLFKDMIFTTKHSDKSPKQFQSLMFKESGVCLMHINIDGFTVRREASLTNPHSRVHKIKFSKISHCDGLLLCNTDTGRLVLWNPCTDQTKWIRPRNNYETFCTTTYALGSYQDKKSNGNSYKILTHNRQCHGFKIYEINSNSWRILDVTNDFELKSVSWGVSLKGKTYWISNRLRIEIISFDYTTERFEHLCLPCQYQFYSILSLSVVREEKLAVLLQHHIGEKTEIWVTNKISETKEVSWSKIFAVDLHPYSFIWGSFVVDEEKKVLVFSIKDRDRVYSVGEDTRIRKVDLDYLSLRPCLFNYVPSLIPLSMV